ncbi:MAG: PASTA domain-containing protein [Elusimicrobiota bacterium]
MEQKTSGPLRFFLRLLGGLLQASIIVACGYLSFDWLMKGMIHARQEVIVPELKGKTLRQAVDELSKVGLALVKESEEYAPQLPLGVVVKQYPLANSTVREGKIVNIALSLGSEKITVPELTGLSLRKAEIELKASHLALGEVEEVHSLRQPRGFVISQEPPALALTEKGDLIHVSVSLGKPSSDRLIIPDFVNKGISEVAAWAKKNRVNLKISERPSDALTNDSVIEQSLKPDTLYNRDKIEDTGLTLEVAVARNHNGDPSGRFLEYTLPAKPLRKREIVLKILSGQSENEIFKTMAEPGERVKIPVHESWPQNSRIRIYLDGVFTQERTFN